MFANPVLPCLLFTSYKDYVGLVVGCQEKKSPRGNYEVKGPEVLENLKREEKEDSQPEGKDMTKNQEQLSL